MLESNYCCGRGFVFGLRGMGWSCLIPDHID
jgi:hypothetical protein